MISLSERELEILKYLIKGYNNEQIGEILFISKHTVKAHISAIIKKLNVKTRTEVAYLAGKYNLSLQFD